MNNKYERILGNEESQSDFWPSFTDMLTTILLVVLLAFMIIMTQTYEELKGKEAVVDELINRVKQQEEDIKEKEEIIESFIGVKGEIIEDLTQKFEQGKIAVRVDKSTGDIYFDSNVLFGYGQSLLKPEAKVQLQAFVPSYMDVLMQYKEEIEEIIVEGHTDDSGSYLYNLGLSQDRAFSVMYYILSEEFGEFGYKEVFKEYATANGKSFSRPIYKEINGKTVIDSDESRRVVFKFRLKGTEYLSNKIDQK